MLHSATLPKRDVHTETSRETGMIDSKFKKEPEVYRVQANSGN